MNGLTILAWVCFGFSALVGLGAVERFLSPREDDILAAVVRCFLGSALWLGVGLWLLEVAK